MPSGAGGIKHRAPQVVTGARPPRSASGASSLLLPGNFPEHRSSASVSFLSSCISSPSDSQPPRTTHCACSCLSCCSLGTCPSLLPRRRAEPPALGAAPRAGRGTELLGLVLSKVGTAGGRGTGTGRARCRRSAGSSHGCASKCGVLLAHPGSRGAPRPDSGLLAAWMLAPCLPQPLQGEKSTRAGTGTGGCLRRAP